MQYILTQEEYDDLRRAQGVLTTNRKDALQRLCTEAANHIPVSVDWKPNEPPSPWGCILTSSHESYCDHCPAIEVCPNEYKEYSQ